MNESKARRHNVIIKWLTLALSIAGFFMAIQTYQDEQKNNRQKERDKNNQKLTDQIRYLESRVDFYKRELWKEQYALYLEACNATTELAIFVHENIDPKSDEFKSAHRKFEKLYHGSLVLVESPEVETQMIAFRTALNKTIKTKNPDCEDLKQIAILLALSCRKSIESAWDVKLGELRKTGSSH